MQFTRFIRQGYPGVVFAPAAGLIVMILGTVIHLLFVFLESYIIIQEHLKNINGNSKVAMPKAYPVAKVSDL